MSSMNFGKYTKDGITFDFDFHHVKSIEITTENVYEPSRSRPNGWATRKIILHATEGPDVVITIFSNGPEIPVEVEKMEDEPIEEIPSPKLVMDVSHADAFIKVSGE
jgi:hypothetical protein